MAQNNDDNLATLAGIDPKFLKLLQALLQGGAPERRATEREVNIDTMGAMDQFRNESYAPRASGVPYIFTGGSPFPQTKGQQQGEKALAVGAFANNTLDQLNSVVPAIVDAWRKRKSQGGGNA